MSAKAMRTAVVARNTSETQISVEIALDGTGQTDIDTGLPFFDHMLNQLGRHGRFDLKVRAKGDLAVDAHHTVEDVGITLGQALSEALGDMKGIIRFADATVPLDESLTRVVIDLSGRPSLHGERYFARDQVNGFELDLLNEFLHGFCNHAKITVHADILRGRNAHHQAESLFKALAKALASAVAVRSGDTIIPSTKEAL